MKQSRLIEDILLLVIVFFKRKDAEMDKPMNIPINPYSLSQDSSFCCLRNDLSRIVSGWVLVIAMSILMVRIGDSLAQAQTTRVSVSSAGVEGNLFSDQTPTLSADGRFVAFESAASNLVVGDTNNRSDIFVHDRQTGVTTRVSVTSAGLEAIETSSAPTLSADGRFVAFASLASNLVSNDTNETQDIFVHDRQTGETTRVSVSSAGVEAEPFGFNDNPTLSADGRFVAFESIASNLVNGDTNNKADIFVHDRQTGVTTRVSVSSTGLEGVASDNDSEPALSADGRFVTFISFAANLVSNDTNDQPDIFVHDRQTEETMRVSVSSLGVEGNDRSSFPAISADGRHVAFKSQATNLVAADTNTNSDIFVHDRQTGETTRVSVSSTGVEANGSDFLLGGPAITGDGQIVAFPSTASNLVSGDTNTIMDIFVHDRQTAETTRVSVSSTGVQANGSNFFDRSPAISASGLIVAFMSSASNLVSGDTNDLPDIFVHERSVSFTTIVVDVFPSGRAVQVGNLASAFATVTNTGPTIAIGCTIVPVTSVPGALFLYAPVDPVTSALIGPANTPVDIPFGSSQKFNITFVPNVALAPIGVSFNVSCTNAATASITPGLNILLLSASITPVADIVALTSAPDGQLVLPSARATSAFLIASLNLGAPDQITMSADTGFSSLPLNLLVCEFDAVLGNCLDLPSPTTTRLTNTGEITFYAVFVVGQGVTIPFNPATNRVFVVFRDSGDVARGLTSVAVQVP